MELTKRKFFTIREATFIRDNYLLLTDKDIAERLGKDRISIKNFRIRGKLMKPMGINKGCFPKNFTPWNKGKTGYMGANITSFKPGDYPKTAMRTGEISIRNNKGAFYQYVRSSGRRRRLLHHVIWEQHHSTIPKNSIVRFRNGDTMDCHIDNLLLVTRAENVRLNANPKKGGETNRKVWDKVKTLEAYGIKFSKYKRSSIRKRTTELVQSIPERTYFA